MDHDADGSNSQQVGPPSGALDDQAWGDSPGRAMVGSSRWWPRNTNNCFETRLYKTRPDGTARTQVTDDSPTAAPAVTKPKRLALEGPRCLPISKG
jgi:hypothetical protein